MASHLGVAIRARRRLRGRRGGIAGRGSLSGLCLQLSDGRLDDRLSPMGVTVYSVGGAIPSSTAGP